MFNSIKLFKILSKLYTHNKPLMINIFNSTDESKQLNTMFFYLSSDVNKVECESFSKHYDESYDYNLEFNSFKSNENKIDIIIKNIFIKQLITINFYYIDKYILHDFLVKEFFPWTDKITKRIINKPIINKSKPLKMKPVNNSPPDYNDKNYKRLMKEYWANYNE